MSSFFVRFESVTINAQTLDCTDEIGFKNPYMQIQSSFIMNSSSKPADVLSSSLMWISPIRSGPHWIDSYWIQFDFLTKYNIVVIWYYHMRGATLFSECV